MANEQPQPWRPSVPVGTTFRLVGLGGTGGLLARPLAMFVSNLPVPTRLFLLDGDSFERENRVRQWFSGSGNKAAVVRDDILHVTRDSLTSVFAIPEFVGQENIARLIPAMPGRQVVILAVDNHATRKLVSDHIEALDLPEQSEIALISGGNDAVEDGRHGTYGNVQVYVKSRPAACAARGSIPLTRYHPEIAQPQDRPPAQLSCVEQIAGSAIQLLATNFGVASALFNAAFLYCCDRLSYSEIYLDVAAGLMRPAAYPAPATVLAGGPPHDNP